MKFFATVIAAVGLLALGATGSWAASAQYCDNYARGVVNKAATGNAITGAVAGGVGGAILGGILGGKKSVGKGAAIGAVGGGVAGATSGTNKRYQAAFDDCMSANAQPVAVPAVGTQSWNYQCSQKYKSFNSNPNYPGYYLGFDGQYHVCQLP